MTYRGATGDTVVAVDADNNALFLQMRTGRLVGANDAVTRLWEEFEANPGLDLDGAVAAAAENMEMGYEELRTQIEDSVRVLIRAGIITIRPPRHRPRLQAIAADETAQPSRREPADPNETPSRRVAIAGGVGLILALVVRRMPFWVQLEVLMAIRRLRPQHATLADTRRLAAAVKRLSRRLPGRSECMEHSLAVFIGGALLGAAPRWCHGGVLQGLVIHAWVQTENVAVDYAPQYGVPPTTMIWI